MARVSSSSLEQKGYNVIDVCTPRKPFVLKYHFCGKKSKWRKIPFELMFTTGESFHVSFIQPILEECKSFRGRLKVATYTTEVPYDLDKDTIYAFARYATVTSARAYGCAKICRTFESKYVLQCFVDRHGALLFTDHWHEIKTVCWQRNDSTFIKKYIPGILEPCQIGCVSTRSNLPLNKEHEFLLATLDKALLKRFGKTDEADRWLEENQYFANQGAPKNLLSDIHGT